VVSRRADRLCASVSSRGLSQTGAPAPPGPPCVSHRFARRPASSAGAHSRAERRGARSRSPRSRRRSRPRRPCSSTTRSRSGSPPSAGCWRMHACCRACLHWRNHSPDPRLRSAHNPTGRGFEARHALRWSLLPDTKCTRFDTTEVPMRLRAEPTSRGLRSSACTVHLAQLDVASAHSCSCTRSSRAIALLAAAAPGGGGERRQ
jgi:hypothetical protein